MIQSSLSLHFSSTLEQVLDPIKHIGPVRPLIPTAQLFPKPHTSPGLVIEFLYNQRIVAPDFVADVASHLILEVIHILYNARMNLPELLDISDVGEATVRVDNAPYRMYRISA